MDKELHQYLVDFLPQREPWMERMETLAQARRIPIMDPVSIHFVKQIIKMKQPEKVLEIGTAIGYSALQMYDAFPSLQMMTIERDSQFYNEALEEMKRQNKEDHIHVVYGDAREKLKEIQRNNLTFDLILIDAAKAQYKELFKRSNPLLTEGGVIISDNVLFKGKVFRRKKTNNRLEKLAHKIHRYNEWLMNREDYMTTIIPVGDGLALSYKKINEK